MTMSWRLGFRTAAALLAGAATTLLGQPGALRYSGICDASAVEFLDTNWVAVADDEDNSLRVYRSDQSGSAASRLPLQSFIGLRRAGEADLEGAARIGDTIYWISSHGRNAKGKLQASRHQFFGTRIDGGARLEPTGRPYHGLLADLLADPRLAGFNLRRASSLAPKDSGGLNIEALAATPDGRLLIGFRNPIINGRALLVPLENPAEVIQGRRARLGDPLLVNLGGLGFRSLTGLGDGYIIVAGTPDGSGKSRFFTWKGFQADPKPLPGIKLGGLNPEALAVVPGSGSSPELFILSDDGTVKVGGTPCKKLKDPALKSFRAVRVLLP